MSLLVEKVDVWAAGIEDKPGALAAKIEALSEAGADLDFLISRRSPERPGTGVVFVAPLRGDAEIQAATGVGFSVSNSLHSVRAQGLNRRGIAAELARKLADAGLSLRGMSGAVIGGQFVIYIALDTAENADKAITVLQQIRTQ